MTFWEKIPHWSLMILILWDHDHGLYILWAEKPTYISASYSLFKDICGVNRLGRHKQQTSVLIVQYKKNRISFQKKIWSLKTYLQPMIKYSNFPSLGFLNCDTKPLSTQHPPGFCSVTALGLRKQEPPAKDKAHAACYAVSTQVLGLKSFISSANAYEIMNC